MVMAGPGGSARVAVDLDRGCRWTSLRLAEANKADDAVTVPAGGSVEWQLDIGAASGAAARTGL
jgi:hypothetical protein